MSATIKEAETKIQKILTEHKLKYGWSYVFPRYTELPDVPDEVKLAISVLERHGMKILVTLKPLRQEEPLG